MESAPTRRPRQWWLTTKAIQAQQEEHSIEPTDSTAPSPLSGMLGDVLFERGEASVGARVHI
jgi:hypothetical protein